MPLKWSQISLKGRCHQKSTRDSPFNLKSLKESNQTDFTNLWVEYIPTIFSKDSLTKDSFLLAHTLRNLCMSLEVYMYCIVLKVFLATVQTAHYDLSKVGICMQMPWGQISDRASSLGCHGNNCELHIVFVQENCQDILIRKYENGILLLSIKCTLKVMKDHCLYHQHFFWKWVIIQWGRQLCDSFGVPDDHKLTIFTLLTFFDIQINFLQFKYSTN